MAYEIDFLKNKLGQLLMIGVAGPALTPKEVTFLRRFQPAGVIYFRRNVVSPKQLAALSKRISHQLEKSPPLIGIDQEGGRVARLGVPFTTFPGNDFLGRYYVRTGKTDLIRAQARAMIRELRTIGVNLNFTPVADVDSRAGNPIIGSRAFSKDPKTVADLVAATVQTYVRERMISCAKHFPGHGHTATDSHKVLPSVRASKATLHKRELIPFQAAIAARVPSLMSAHVMYPALDRKRPATLSARASTELLRDELGFNGVLISDDLEMGAIARHSSLADAAIEAINAGVDLLLVCKSLEQAESVWIGLEAALWKGRISEKRFSEALGRVASLKKRYRIARFRGTGAVPRNGWARHQWLSETIQINGEDTPTWRS